MSNWQEWRKEIREERKDSPVETFVLLLFSVFIALCALAFVGVVFYHIPIPAIFAIVVTFVLWKLYKRL